MNKPTTLTTLKVAALGATLGAAANLGLQLAGGHIHPLQIGLTAFAALAVGFAVAEDTARLLRLGHQRIARSRRPGGRFRTRHGNPATWNNNEYEAYFALTADDTANGTANGTNIHPVA